jgi:hypothetical protein
MRRSEDGRLQLRRTDGKWLQVRAWRRGVAWCRPLPMAP